MTTTVPAPPGQVRPQLRARPLARAHPLAKLGAAFVVTIALLLTVDPVSAGVALVCELAALPLSGLSYAALVRRGWPILAAALLSGYSTALLAADSGRTLLAVGTVTVSSGAVTSGLAITLRALAIALPGVLVLTCTDPTDLADGLAQKLRLPHRFVLSALAALRLVGLLSQEWSTLAMARRARGAGARGGHRARSARRGRLSVASQLEQGLALLVQAIRRATRLAVTMEARGFGRGERTWARASTYAPIDAVVAAAGALVAAAALTAAVLAGTWNPIWS